MYRLLIVEDEKWEREGLRDFLDWYSLGIEVVGCACNGVEGLKVAELCRPDIVLTDILMPKMDGIVMSQRICSLLPDAKIVIISGYDDFQYAKQSFSFHAVDYILKPIKKESITEVILHIIEVLDQKRSRENETKALKKQWMEYIHANRDQLLLDILECKTDIEYIPGLIPIIEPSLQQKKVIAILSFGSVSHDFDEKMIHAIGRMLDQKVIAYAFSNTFKDAVLCMDSPDVSSELDAELYKLRDQLKKELQIEAILCVGEPVEDLPGLSRSYMQAKEIYSFRFLSEYGEVLYHHELKKKTCSDLSPVILRICGIIQKILYSVQKNDMDRCVLETDHFLALLKENKTISIMLLSKFYTEASGLHEALFDDSTDTMELGLTKSRFDKLFADLDSLSETKEYLADFLKRIAAHSSHVNGHEEEIIKKVITIIEERYASNLDLKQISREIHLTPYYFGKIFKKHTGKPFNRYLNEYRIDQAKEILQTKKIKISCLADAVGIPNSSYFCSLFKSRFGMSPGEYKDMLKGSQDYV